MRPACVIAVLATTIGCACGFPAPQTLAQQYTTAPAVFTAQLDTHTPGGTSGKVLIEVHREWAPRGADRFYQLIKANFFAGAKVFRVVPGFVVQWGINANPAVEKAWRGGDANIKDDKVKKSNGKGTVSFATSGPDTRSTQLFINLGNNYNLDDMGFSPIGRVVHGMSTVEKMYSGYGENPDQNRITNEGNQYLDAEFPKLTAFTTTSIVGGTAPVTEVQD